MYNTSAVKSWIFVTAFISASVLLIGPALAGQGCCSSHGGEAGCAGSRLLCKDGKPSPTCRCDRAAKHFHVKDARVNTDTMHQKTSDALGAVRDVWNENHLPDPVVTSANDSKHPGSNKPGTRCGPSNSEAECRATSDSLHYKDKAIDLRSHDMDPETKKAVISELKQS